MRVAFIGGVDEDAVIRRPASRHPVPTGMFDNPYNDPQATDPPEAWLCRFGDHAHESFDVARDLALMAMLTETRPDPEWLFNALKRLVRIDDAGHYCVWSGGSES